MRKYELVFIVRTDVPEEDVEKLLTQMQGVVTTAGGKIEKAEKMGRRRLAYRVRRQREGLYVLLVFEGGGDVVKELERRLKVADPVIKFLTVRTDEELKRAEKMKAARARQESKKRRPKPAAPPAISPAEAEATAQA
jgi:small subunit ribosomal protein S6